MTDDDRRVNLLIAAALVSVAVLPWYHIQSGFFGFSWLVDWTAEPGLWPGLAQPFSDRWWLWPLPLLLLAVLALRIWWPAGPRRGRALTALGVVGLVWLAIEGLSVGLRGWNWRLLEALFGAVDGQPAFGAGAVSAALCFAGLVSLGLAERGALKGDAFVISAITLLVLLVATGRRRTTGASAESGVGAVQCPPRRSPPRASARTSATAPTPGGARPARVPHAVCRAPRCSHRRKRDASRRP
jgi:iron(III) transport system permease protein